jgi:hypothetical protein
MIIIIIIIIIIMIIMTNNNNQIKFHTVTSSHTHLKPISIPILILILKFTSKST